MAASSFAINFQGFVYSATSAYVDLDGKKYFGLRTLNFKDELPQEKQYGFGMVAVGRTRGNYNPSADMEILLHEGQRLIEGLCAKAKAQTGSEYYFGVPFDIGVVLVEQAPLGFSSIQILGATIEADEIGIQQGGAALVHKFTLNVIRPILKDGKPSVPDPIGANNTGGINIGLGSAFS